MGAPRRQSSRLAGKAKASTEQSASDNEEDYSIDATNDKDTNSNGSEHGRKSKRAKTTHAKATSTSASTTTKPRGRLRNLALLVTLPLDLLFEVFGQLSPVDLINLSRANKLLRDTLMSRHSASVWTTVRKRNDMPDCPSDMSEPAWAVLGCMAVCEVCDARGIQKIDFQLLRRICVRCKKKNLLAHVKVKKAYPDLEYELLDYIPFTNLGPWSNGWASSTKFYWAGDIDNMVEKMNEFTKAIRSGNRVQAAKKNLQDFKDMQIAVLEEKNKHGAALEKWCDRIRRSRADESRDITEARYTNLRNRFIELGYTAEDVKSSIREHNFPSSKTATISNHVFAGYRAQHEWEIADYKIRRMEREHKDIMKQRRDIVVALHTEYQRSLPPLQWAYTPAVDIVIRWPAFRGVYTQAIENDVARASFQQPEQKLPKLVQDWQDFEKRAILKALDQQKDPSDTEYDDDDSDTEDIADICLDATNVARLALATNVISLHYRWRTIVNWPRIGLDGVLSLNSEGCNPASYRPSHCGAAAARFLVELLGLDPETALASDMDRLNRRFTCRRCRLYFDNGYPGNVYTWRECINHSTRCLWEEPQWILLEPSVALPLIARQSPDPAYNQKAWSCNHCAEYLENWDVRRVVMSHLNTAHNISDGKEPTDLFFYLAIKRASLRVIRVKVK